MITHFYLHSYRSKQTNKRLKRTPSLLNGRIFCIPLVLYVLSETNLTNHVDEIIPYGTNIDTVRDTFEQDVSILITVLRLLFEVEYYI